MKIACVVVFLISCVLCAIFENEIEEAVVNFFNSLAPAVEEPVQETLLMGPVHPADDSHNSPMTSVYGEFLIIESYKLISDNLKNKKNCLNFAVFYSNQWF